MQVVKFKNLPAMPKMGCTIKFLFPADVDMIFAVLTLRKGERFPSHMHKICKEVYYVMKGRAVLTIGNETREVNASDGVLIPPNNFHTIRNDWNEPMEFVAARAPNIPSDSYALSKEQDRTWRDDLTRYIRAVTEATRKE